MITKKTEYVIKEYDNKKNEYVIKEYDNKKRIFD